MRKKGLKTIILAFVMVAVFATTAFASTSSSFVVTANSSTYSLANTASVYNCTSTMVTLASQYTSTPAVYLKVTSNTSVVATGILLQNGAVRTITNYPSYSTTTMALYIKNYIPQTNQVVGAVVYN